jgi:hypothetical protein
MPEAMEELTASVRRMRRKPRAGVQQMTSWPLKLRIPITARVS